ncbi:MAG: hypothetical protein ABW074_01365 [Sedimenticola sp.]
MEQGTPGPDVFDFDGEDMGPGFVEIQNFGPEDTFDFSALSQMLSGNESVLSTGAGGLGDLVDQGVVVLTDQAYGDANALQGVLNTSDFDQGPGGARVVVWEMGEQGEAGLSVGVALVSNAEGEDDVQVEQVAQITGFTDQSAVDTFTESLDASNFETDGIV